MTYKEELLQALEIRKEAYETPNDERFNRMAEGIDIAITIAKTIPDRVEGYVSLYDVREFIKSYCASTDVAFHMIEHLNEIPLSNVRPVVLCRECKHRQNPRKSMCIGRGPDWYCAAGERMDSGNA